MKYLWQKICVVTVSLGFFLPAAVFAEEITRFHSDIHLWQENTVTVVETIHYDFSGNSDERHGIYRDIPQLFTESEQCDGVDQANPVFCERKITHPITVQSVVDETGKSHPFTLEESTAEWLRIKIGDPDKIVSGKRVYVITYTFSTPVLYNPENNTDRFIWNITGSGWNVPIQEASATIVLPEESTKMVREQVCYTGQNKSSSQECEIQSELSSTTIRATQSLPASNGLTVDISLEPEAIADRGIVALSLSFPECLFGYCLNSPPVTDFQFIDNSTVVDSRSFSLQSINAVNSTILLSLPTGPYEVFTQAFLHTTKNTSIILSAKKDITIKHIMYKNIQGTLLSTVLPIGTSAFYLLFAAGLWYRYGRDPRHSHIIVTEFTPPQSITPLEASVLLKGDMTNKHISAQIIELAIRGYIVIQQTEQSGVSGLLKKGAYDYAYKAVADRIQADWSTEKLSYVDREMLTAFFGVDAKE